MKGKEQGKDIIHHVVSLVLAEKHWIQEKETLTGKDLTQDNRELVLNRPRCKQNLNLQSIFLVWSLNTSTLGVVFGTK